MGDRKIIFHHLLEPDDPRHVPAFRQHKQYSCFTLRGVKYQLGDYASIKEKKQHSVSHGKSSFVQIVRIVDLGKEGGLLVVLWFTLGKYYPPGASFVIGLPKLDPESEIFWDRRMEHPSKLCPIKHLDRKVNVQKIEPHQNPAKERAKLKVEYVVRFSLCDKGKRLFFIPSLAPEGIPPMPDSVDEVDGSSQSKKLSNNTLVSRLGQFQHETQFNNIMDEPSPSESVKVSPRKRQPTNLNCTPSKAVVRVVSPRPTPPVPEWSSQDLTRSPEKSPVCMRFTRNKVPTKQVATKKKTNEEDALMVDSADYNFETPVDRPFPKRLPRKKLMDKAVASTSQSNDSPFLDEVAEQQADKELRQKRQKKIDKVVQLALRNPLRAPVDTSAMEESDIEGGKPILSLNMPKFVTQMVKDLQKKTPTKSQPSPAKSTKSQQSPEKSTKSQHSPEKSTKSQQSPEKWTESQQSPAKSTKQSKPALVPYRLKSQVEVNDEVDAEIEDENTHENSLDFIDETQDSTKSPKKSIFIEVNRPIPKPKLVKKFSKFEDSDSSSEDCPHEAEEMLGQRLSRISTRASSSHASVSQNLSQIKASATSNTRSSRKKSSSMSPFVLLTPLGKKHLKNNRDSERREGINSRRNSNEAMNFQENSDNLNSEENSREDSNKNMDHGENSIKLNSQKSSADSIHSSPDKILRSTRHAKGQSQKSGSELFSLIKPTDENLQEDSSSDELIEGTPPSSPIRFTRSQKSPIKNSPHKRRLFFSEPVAGGSGLNLNSKNFLENLKSSPNKNETPNHEENLKVAPDSSDSDFGNPLPQSVRNVLRTTPRKADNPIATAEDLMHILSDSPVKESPVKPGGSHVVMKLFEKNLQLRTSTSPGIVSENPFMDPLIHLIGQGSKSHSPGRIFVEGSRRKRKSAASSVSSEIELSPNKSCNTGDEMEVEEDSSELSEVLTKKTKAFQQKHRIKIPEPITKVRKTTGAFNVKTFVQKELVNEEFPMKTRTSPRKSSVSDLHVNGFVEETDDSEPCNEISRPNSNQSSSSSTESQYFTPASDISPEKMKKSSKNISQTGNHMSLRLARLNVDPPQSIDTQFYTPQDTPELPAASPSKRYQDVSSSCGSKYSPSKVTTPAKSPKKVATPNSSPKKVEFVDENSPNKTSTQTRLSLKRDSPSNSPKKLNSGDKNKSSNKKETEYCSPKKISMHHESPKTPQVADSPRKNSRIGSELATKNQTSPRKSREMFSSDESVIYDTPKRIPQPIDGAKLRELMKTRMQVNLPNSFFMSQNTNGSDIGETASQLNEEDYTAFLFPAQSTSAKKSPRKIKDVNVEMSLPSTSKSPFKSSRVNALQVEQMLCMTATSDSSDSSPSRRKQQIVPKEYTEEILSSPVEAARSRGRPRRSYVDNKTPPKCKYERKTTMDIVDKKRGALQKVINTAREQLRKKMSGDQYVDLKLPENVHIGCLKTPMNRIQTPPPSSFDSELSSASKARKSNVQNKRAMEESDIGETPSPKRRALGNTSFTGSSSSKAETSVATNGTDSEEFVRSPLTRRESAKNADTSASLSGTSIKLMSPNKKSTPRKGLSLKMTKSSVADALSEPDDDSDFEEARETRSKATPVKELKGKRTKKVKNDMWDTDILTPSKQNVSQLSHRRQASCEPATSPCEDILTPKSKSNSSQKLNPDVQTPRRSSRSTKPTPKRKQNEISQEMNTPTRKQSRVSQPTSTPTRKPQATKQEKSKEKEKRKKRKTEATDVEVDVQQLPGREKEMQSIKSFVLRKFDERSGGCMYISGVPGTGKTASVNQIILQLQECVNEGEISDFKLVQVSGMELVQPQQIYSKMVRDLLNVRMTYNPAQLKLDTYFNNKDAKRPPTLLIIDELDMVCTRRQDVVYSIFDWATLPRARLTVLAIANTMDLPERVLKAKVTSRLGLTRLVFRPYSFEQLKQIVMVKLPGIAENFHPDALELIARKVASVSGDARRTIELCRRASSLAGENELITLPLVTQALKEMTCAPVAQAVRSCSGLDRLFLRCLLSEMKRTGLEESTLKDVFLVMKETAAFEGYFGPRCLTQVCESVSRLSAIRLILASEFETGTFAQRLSLNVSSDELFFALADLT